MAKSAKLLFFKAVFETLIALKTLIIWFLQTKLCWSEKDETDI